MAVRVGDVVFLSFRVEFERVMVGRLEQRNDEGLWEEAKREGRKDFESGHLAANHVLPSPGAIGVGGLVPPGGKRAGRPRARRPDGGSVPQNVHQDAEAGAGLPAILARSDQHRRAGEYRRGRRVADKCF